MTIANGIDTEDGILRDTNKFVPTRKKMKTPKIKLNPDTETFAKIKVMRKDLTADITMGDDVLDLEGPTITRVPVKLYLGEGDSPYAKIRLPQVGDMVLVKYYQDRSQMYIDRTVYIWDGEVQNRKIKDTILSLLESVKDWIDYHISGTYTKIKENGDVLIQIKNGQQATIQSDKYKIEATEDYVLIDKEGMKVNVTKDNVELGKSSLKRLIDERMVSKHNLHTHSGVTPGGSATGPPVTPITLNDVATSETKAS